MDALHGMRAVQCGAGPPGGWVSADTGGLTDWLLPPRPGSLDTDSGALPPCKEPGGTTSRNDTTWLSLLAHASFGLEIRGKGDILV